jgi:hypothetical protein
MNPKGLDRGSDPPGPCGDMAAFRPSRNLRIMIAKSGGTVNPPRQSACLFSGNDWVSALTGQGEVRGSAESRTRRDQD